MRSVTGVMGVAALALLLSACGTTQEQRTATGGLAGLGAGAIIGGPVGAAVGVAAGAVGGALMPEDATSIANNLLGREHRATASALGMPNRSASAAPGASQSAYAGSGSSEPPDVIKTAQWQLKDQGYYHGNIDGIVGPKTRSATRLFQARQGLRQTGRLDRPTLTKLNVAASSQNESHAAANQPPSRPVQNQAPSPAAANQQAAPPPPQSGSSTPSVSSEPNPPPPSAPPASNNGATGTNGQPNPPTATPPSQPQQ